MSEAQHNRWRDDVAAYLLGSLEPSESEQLQRHLEDCESCRNELRWLRPAIEVLADSVQCREPPAALRERLLEEVRSDARRAAEARDEPARRSFADRMRGFMLRPATALATAAVIAAAVGGYVVAGGGGGDRETTIFQEEVRGPTAASATLSREGDTGTLRLAGVEQPSGAQVYQAWVQRGTRVRPSSQLVMRPGGVATARIPGLDRVDNVMVTLEDRPGRSQPTASPLVTLELES